MMRGFILLTLLMGPAPMVLGQNCKADLMSLYEVLAEKSIPKDDTQFHAQYVIVQESWEGKKTRYEFELYADKNKNYLLSKDFSVFSDSLVTIAVQKMDSTIYIGSTLDVDIKQQSVTRVLQSQPKSLEMMTEEKCEASAAHQGGTQLVLSYSDEYQKAFQIESIEFEFDENMLFSVRASHTQEHHLKETTYLIKSIENGDSFSVLMESPRSFILGPDNEVKKDFQNFSIEQIGQWNQVELQPKQP